jgi:hypothetical protein
VIDGDKLGDVLTRVREHLNDSKLDKGGRKLLDDVEELIVELAELDDEDDDYDDEDLDEDEDDDDDDDLDDEDEDDDEDEGED